MTPWNAVWSRIEALLHARKSRWKATEQKLFRSVFTQKDPAAEPVFPPSPPGRGAGGEGNPGTFEPDADLRDFENVPLKDDAAAVTGQIDVRQHAKRQGASHASAALS